MGLQLKTSLSEVKNLGDCIIARYTAPLSAVGVISQIGISTVPFIDISGVSEPDGSFLLIFVGYDFAGRKRFIADRNLQNNISWVALNDSGLITGVEINQGVGFICTLRLLTSRADTSDSDDNEWNQIVVGSSLGGSITPGDVNIWNTGSIRSWSAVSASSSTYRAIVGGPSGITTVASVVATTVAADIGFRPVLVVGEVTDIKVSVLTPEVHKQNGQLKIDLYTPGYQLKYKITLNNSVLIPFGNFVNSPLSLDQVIANNVLAVGNNSIKVDLESSGGEKVFWQGAIVKNNSAPVITLVTNSLNVFTVNIADADADVMTSKIERLNNVGSVIQTLANNQTSIDISTVDFRLGDKIRVTVTDDIATVTAEYNPVLPVPTVQNINLISVIHMEDSSLSFSILNPKNNVEYKVTIGNVVLVDWTGFMPPQAISLVISKDILTWNADTVVRIDVLNEAGNTVQWTGTVLKSNAAPVINLMKNTLKVLELKLTDNDGDDMAYQIKHLAEDGSVKAMLSESPYTGATVGKIIIS